MLRLARALMIFAVLAVVAAGTAWWLIEPDLRARASRAASHQLGDGVAIGRLRPSPKGLVADDVSFDRRERGLELRADSIAMSPSWSSVVGGDALVVRAVRLDGVDIVLSGGQYGSADALRRFLPNGRRLLSLTGLRVEELRRAGVEVTDDAVVTFVEVRMWHLDEGTGARTLVHAEPRLVFRRRGDTFVLDE